MTHTFIKLYFSTIFEQMCYVAFNHRDRKILFHFHVFSGCLVHLLPLFISAFIRGTTFQLSSLRHTAVGIHAEAKKLH